ncbi:GAF domain-containing protein [uncultured Roseobacter sp.]|uniref:GAF domain-containing protein n=1 Tax=uncultured Roseobacter sp. TaxID=114847 RepID=UPI002625CC43|nr:GAF domain-containing protein [uncultured Roseobacter sp.]
MAEIRISETAGGIAARLKRDIEASVVLITETLQDKHVVHACIGLELPQRLRHELPLGYPVCEHTVAMGFPLIVDDAFNHPLLTGNPAVTELGIGSYAGAPLFRIDGQAGGAICAMQPHIHRWSAAQIEIILEASRSAEKVLFQQFITMRCS